MRSHKEALALDSDRIALALERIAQALEVSNEGSQEARDRELSIIEKTQALQERDLRAREKHNRLHNMPAPSEHETPESGPVQ